MDHPFRTGAPSISQLAIEDGSLLSGRPLLPDAQGPDLYLTALGALLTAVYCAGAVFRSKRMLFGAGIDSLIVLALYVVGVAGLFFIRA